MSTAPDIPDDDMLAAEYSLRLLDGEAMLATRGRLATDRGFAAAVEQWDARLTGFLDEIAPVQPDVRMWDRIVRAVRPQAEEAVVPLPRGRRWKVPAALTAAAASIALIVGVWSRSGSAPEPVSPAAPPRVLVASLAPEGAPALATARYDPRSRTLIVDPAAPAPPAGQSRELWVIPADGRPRSLGLLPTGVPLRIAFADDLAAAFSGASTLAISAEREGGSRTGQPEGPVVATGKLGPPAVAG